MASIIQNTEVNASVPAKLAYVGRAWLNTSNKDGHTQYIRLKIDRKVAGVSLVAGDSMLLFANRKRDGKKDADYRVAIENKG